MVRDPRDVVASLTQQTWAPSDPIEATQFYMSIMQRWDSIRGHIPKESFRVVRLEDLVTDTESILRTLCDFWGLEWNAKLLELPLNKAHSGRWKSDIPSQFHEQMHQLLKPVLIQFDYE
jgi:hypothetical protein